MSVPLTAVPAVAIRALVARRAPGIGLSRHILPLVFLLLSACEPAYVNQGYSGHVAYRHPRHNVLSNDEANGCARDPGACPAPPPLYRPGEALPSLLPDKSGPSEAPSY